MEPQDLPDWVKIFLAIGAGGGVKALFDWWKGARKEAKTASRSDNEQLIANLETQLKKSEAEVKDLKEGYALADGRIQALNKRANELEVAKTRVETELRFLEKNYEDLTARYKESRAVIDNLRGKK